MATIRWKVAADGDWNTASNWTGGAVPGASDDVVLHTAAFHTVTHSIGASTIRSLAAVSDALAMTGGSLAILQSSSFTKGLELAGGTLALSGASSTATGAVLLDGGTLLLGAAAKLTVSGTLTIGELTSAKGEIDGPGTFSTRGATNFSPDYVNLVVGGGLHWTNSGTLSAGTGITVGSTQGAAASFSNTVSGVFNLTGDSGGIAGQYVTADGTYALGTSTFTNTGLLEKTGGFGASTIDSVIGSTGRISVTTGTLDLTGGGVLGGTISGPGTVQLGGGVFRLSTPKLTGGVSLVLGGGTLAIAAGKTVGNVTVSSGGAVGPGTLSTSGATNISFSSGYTFSLDGGVTWVNSGRLSLQSVTVAAGSLGGAAVSIVNTATGTVDLSYYAGVSNPGGNAIFRNAGLLERSIPSAVDISTISASLINTGTVRVAGGAISLQGGGTLGGAFNGGGTIALAAGRFTLNAPKVAAGTALVLAGGTVVITAGATVSSLQYAFGEIDGPGTLANSGSVSIGSTYTYSSLTLGDNILLRNSGVFNLANGGLVAGDAAGLTARISNLASGVFDFTGDTSISNAYLYLAGTYTPGSSTFANAGLLEKTGGTGISVLASALTNTGKIKVASGTLSLIGGGTLGGSITGGGTVLLSGGFFSLDAPTVSADTALVLAGGTVAITTSASLSGLAVSFGEIDGPGTLGNTGSLALGDASAIYPAGLVLSGGLVMRNSGTITVRQLTLTAGTQVSLVNTASGVFDLTGDTSIFSAYGATPSFRNDGLLEKTGGAATSLIQSALTNTGTIRVTAGTLALGGGGTIGGAIAGGGELDLNYGSFVLDGPTVESGTSLRLTGGTIAIGDGRTVSTIGLVAGEIDGPGTFATAGTTSAGSVTLDGSATWVNTGRATVTSLTLGEATQVVNQAGGTLQLGGVLAYQSSTLSNAGLLVLSAGGFGSYIDAAISNAGTIAVSNAVAGLRGGGRLAGRLSGTGEIMLSGGTFAAGGLTQDGSATLALSGAAMTLAAGTTAALAGAFLAEAGTVRLAKGALLSLSGTVSFGDGAGGLARLDGPGGLFTSGQVLVAESDYTDGTPMRLGGGVVWRNSGTVTDTGFIRVGDGSGLKAVFINTASGVFAIASDDGGIGNNAVLSPGGVFQPGSATFANAGLLVKNGGDGRSFIAAVVTNSGTIEAGSGTLDLLNPIAGTGALLIDAGATLETAGIGSGQAITFDGAGGTLLLDLAQSVTTPISGLAAGDAFDLSFASGASAAINGSTLTITPTGGTALTFVSATSLSGETASVADDGNGGTIVTLVGAGGQAHAAIGQAAALNGATVHGFGTATPIDLTDVAFTSLRALGFTQGRLHVSDGRHAASLTLPGVARLADVAAASDGHGGTLLLYHPQ